MSNLPVFIGYLPGDQGGRTNHAVFRFPNDYGASVIPDGIWFELAVLHFHGPAEHEHRLVYDTPVTSDVLRGLSVAEVAEELDRIAALPRRVRGIRA